MQEKDIYVAFLGCFAVVVVLAAVGSVGFPLILITCLVFCFDLCSVLFPLLVITETITKPEILMVVFDLMLFSCFQ